MRRSTLVLFSAVVALGLFAVGCDSAGLNATENPEGSSTLQMFLTDAPGDILEASVVIESVSIVPVEDSADGDSTDTGVSVLSAEDFEVDLTRLQGGVDTLMAELKIGAGEYGQVRLRTASPDEFTVMYEDDNGEVAELPAEINSTLVAPIEISIEKINESAFTEFPRVDGESNNNVTWTEGAEWSTSTDGGSMSVSESSPAGTVDAVTFTATAGASSTANATYDNFTISQDATKRVAQVGMNVDSLAAGSNVTVRFQESDGDYVALEVNQSVNASADGGIANATGEGWVEQQRLGHENMSVEGTGDGSLGSIDKVVVHVSGGDATVELFWLDTEKKGETELGTRYYDDDDDDALRQQSETLVDKDFAGAMRVSSMDDLSSEFDSAIIYDKTVYDLEYRPEYVSSEDLNLSVTDAEAYPSFEKLFEGYYRLSVPTPIDVTHGSIALMGSRGGLPDERFETIEYKIGTGSTDMHNVTGWSTHSFSSDDPEELATGVSAGDNVVIHDEILYTDAEFDALTSGAVAGGPVGSGDGGVIGFLTSLPGIVLSGIVGFLGIRRFTGS